MSRHDKNGKKVARDVLERYCPHIDDNVIMLRRHGAGDKYTCLSSGMCRSVGTTDMECADELAAHPNCAHMPMGNGLYDPKDNGPIPKY